MKIVEENNVIAQKTYRFAVRIVKLYRYLRDEKKEFILSSQLERSGTSIRANVSESQYAQSRGDFIAKLSIAAKEAAETKYWIDLLHDTGYLTDREFRSIQADCVEILKLLTSILKTTKNRPEQQNY